MPQKSPVDTSAANAVATRSLVAYAEWEHSTTFEPGSAILAWAGEFSGQLVSNFQRSVSDGQTAYERKKPQSARSVRRVGDVHPDGEPKDKGVGSCGRI